MGTWVHDYVVEYVSVSPGRVTGTAKKKEDDFEVCLAVIPQASIPAGNSWPFLPLQMYVSPTETDPLGRRRLIEQCGVMSRHVSHHYDPSSHLLWQ